MTFIRKYKGSLLVVLVLFIGVIWWSNDYISKRDTVTDALKSSIQQAAVVVQLQAKERDKVVEANSMPYYAVNMRDSGNQLKMQLELLYALNSYEALPPVKLTSFRLSQMSSIDVQATVDYVTMFGIHKEVTVQVNVPRTPFKNETGEEVYP